MQAITTIGLDIAKSVFQVHGIDAEGNVLIRRQLKRRYVQQTSVINAIRAHLAEFGIVAPVGRQGVEQLLGVAADTNDKRLPEVARACVAALGAQLRTLKAQIPAESIILIRAWHRSDEESPAARRYPRCRSGIGDRSGCQCR